MYNKMVNYERRGSILNRIDIFEQFDKVEAFFSIKPDRSLDLIPALSRALKEGEYFIKPHMVHGKHVEVIDEEFLNAEHIKIAGYPELSDVQGYIEVPMTDGLVTDLPGVAIVTTHGDCIGVFAFDPVKRAVGVAHAGWKGTMLGIAGELVKTMKERYGCRAEDIYTYISPGIDKCHFEVKDDVRQQFIDTAAWTEKYIVRKDDEHFLIDLKGVNRRYLELEGIKNIEINSDCTYCLEDRYWSYRRSKDKDRMLAYIRLLY